MGNEMIEISKASEDDVAALVQLVNGAYRGESSKKGWTTEADLLGGVRTSIESMQEQLQTPGAVVLKAMKGSEIIGCVYLQNKTDHLYLGMLTVKPTLQGSGTGKRLLQAAEKYARSLALPAIKMTVITVRTELIAWYKRHGYADTGERCPFPTDPKFGLPKQSLEFLVLEKKLAH